MTFSPKAIALGLASTLVLATPAVAQTTGESIDQCLVTMEAEAGATFADATYKFKKIRGSSTKKLTFTMTDGEMKETVVCKVRRGEIKDIEWPATVVASLEEATDSVADNS